MSTGPQTQGDNSTSLSIVIPCYNEAQNLPHLVARVQKAFAAFDAQKLELLLVQNGSTDSSAEVMQALQNTCKYLRVHTVPKNRGYGNGVFEGLKAAKYQTVAYSHADLQCDPADILKAFEIFSEKRNEKLLVKGMRAGRTLGSWIFSRFFEFTTLLFLQKWIFEANAQPKLFSKTLVSKLKNPPLDFTFDLYLLLEAKRHGYHTSTFSVLFPPRQFGQSHWAGSFKSKLKTMQAYVKFLIRYRKNQQKASKHHGL